MAQRSWQMLDTLAKTAFVGSILSFYKRATGQPQASSVMGAVGLVAAGIVIGAGAALFFAPKTGAELRADVRTRARRLTAGASEKLASVRDAAMGENSSLEQH